MLSDQGRRAVIAALDIGEGYTPDDIEIVERGMYGEYLDCTVSDARPPCHGFPHPDDVFDGTPFFVGTINLVARQVTEDRTPEVF
jgi:hypothetical protein